ncbi:Protein Star, partial [Armadillidium vulgare]
KNGTFIEAGAFDGEKLSNTLILERELGWTGLLIEPNPINYKNIPHKHRRAHYAQCCLSLTTRASNMSISLHGLTSRVTSRVNRDQKKRTTKFKRVKVNCYPLFSLMVAANLTTLDLLSLDLESVEVK